MAYTSEQYKYLLFRILQRHFSNKYIKDRYYTRDFFQKLFDGIEVTESSYNQMVDLINDNIRYSADNNVIDASDITQAMIDERGIMLIDAFAAIGIELVIYRASMGTYGTATFTKPDGTVMEYYVSDENDFYINAKCGQEYSYAKKADPYYQLENIDVKSLDEIDYQMCGPDCYWRYDADTATMTITGSGTYCGVTKQEQMGSGTYTTLIIGANVSALYRKEAANSASLTTVVLLHAADFPLEFLADFGYLGSNTTRTWDVYTDNEAFRNHAWNSNLTINWHTLDEWEG